MTRVNDDVTFQVDTETLSGRFIRGGDTGLNSKPSVLFLHGAGKATKERALPLALQFADEGITSFAFDFSGHGESTGTLANSSLQKRLREAEAAVSFAGFRGGYAICAFSMAGHIALEMLERNPIGTLLLFYPAVYSSDAFPLCFGDPSFTRTIREDGSWKQSRAFELLESFTGNLLIVVGAQDEVIPSDVIKQLDVCSRRAAKKKIVTIENAPHLLLPTLLNSSQLFKEICATASEYISSGA